MTIQAFADKHGLVMEIHERERPSDANMRFWANFKLAEVREGCCLAGVLGNGATPKDAVREYATKISLKTLVIDAFHDRKEIKVPRLTRNPTGG